MKTETNFPKKKKAFMVLTLHVTIFFCIDLGNSVGYMAKLPVRIYNIFADWKLTEIYYTLIQAYTFLKYSSRRHPLILREVADQCLRVPEQNGVTSAKNRQRGQTDQWPYFPIYIYIFLWKKNGGEVLIFKVLTLCTSMPSDINR